MIDKTEILNLLPQSEGLALTSRQVFEQWKGGDDVKEVSDALGNLWRSGVISRKQNPDGKLAYYRLTDSEMAIIAQSNAYTVKPTKKPQPQEAISKTILNVISPLEKESDIAQRLMAYRDQLPEATTLTPAQPSVNEADQFTKADAELLDELIKQNPLDVQIGGDHYKKLGDYQPWEVLKRWLTPEEFRGYMKGTAIAYLARERDKGGDMDIEKSKHTLEGLLALGVKTE